MFPTERAGETGMPAYYDRIKTRIGHWTSTDAIHWNRQSTIYQASGTYAVTDDDNPLNDRRGAIWSYMPVFNEKTNRWNGFYLAYTCHKTIQPNHSFGRIWRCESEKEGIDGIGGPYRDLGIVMEPGLDSQLWEGRQGVDSFFPYKVGDKWLSLYGGAFPWAKWSDYPKTSQRGWLIGLAQSNTLEGPWIRMDTTIIPFGRCTRGLSKTRLLAACPMASTSPCSTVGPMIGGCIYPICLGIRSPKTAFTGPKPIISRSIQRLKSGGTLCGRPFA